MLTFRKARSPNGRFLRHRPKRSERCLNYGRLYQGQRSLPKDEGVPEGPQRKNHVRRPCHHYRCQRTVRLESGGVQVRQRFHRLSHQTMCTTRRSAMADTTMRSGLPTRADAGSCQHPHMTRRRNREVRDSGRPIRAETRRPRAARRRASHHQARERKARLLEGLNH